MEQSLLTPDFPTSAYISLVFMVEGENIIGIYPMSSVYESLDDIAQSIFAAADSLVENDTYEVHEVALVLPIKFHSLFPLKREYWENPKDHFDDMHRVKAFAPVIRFPELYQLLVTPSQLDKDGRWHFTAALPFTVSDRTPAILEQFMLNSDFPVFSQADSSAIYLIGKSSHFNWRTGEIVEIEEPLKPGTNN